PRRRGQDRPGRFRPADPGLRLAQGGDDARGAGGGGTGVGRVVTHTLAVLGRSLKAFYDDQMTHHAAALTYYALMSLFPAVLLALSLLGLIGQYPATYDAILGYLRDVVPRSLLEPLDRSLRGAFRAKGT